MHPTPQLLPQTITTIDYTSHRSGKIKIMIVLYDLCLGGTTNLPHDTDEWEYMYCHLLVRNNRIQFLTVDIPLCSMFILYILHIIYNILH
jgi:hypothetical protein